MTNNSIEMTLERSSSPSDEESKKRKISDESFDPYECGKEDGINSFGASVHIIRYSIGAGVLLMPYIMKNMGFVTGTVLLLGSAFVYFHTVRTLLATEYRVCKRLKLKNLSYVDLADKIFESSPFPVNKCRKFIRASMYLFYAIPTGNATYLIVMANAIQTLAKFFDLNLETKLVITVIIIPLTLFCMFRKILEILVPYSSATNAFSLLMASAIVVYAATNRKASAKPMPFGDARLLPQSVAICVKAFRCTALILPVKNDMKKPQKLSATFGALNVAATTIALFHYLFGIILYLNYGSEVRENVLLNLPANDYLTHVINLFYVATLFVSYVLVFFGRFDNVWSGPLKQNFVHTKYSFFIEYAIRISINAIAYGLAIGVPNLAVISAMAGTTGIILEVALPSVLELLSVLDSRENSHLIVLKNLCITAVCFALFFWGFYGCIESVVKLYSQQE